MPSLQDRHGLCDCHVHLQIASQRHVIPITALQFVSEFWDFQRLLCRNGMVGNVKFSYAVWVMKGITQGTYSCQLLILCHLTVWPYKDILLRKLPDLYSIYLCEN